MQALSSYSPARSPTIEPALRALEEQHEHRRLTADSCFSEKGLFARFVWPDWPRALGEQLRTEVERFCAEHKLEPVAEGSEAWKAVFRDWRADPESASVIGKAFSNRFGERILWVESEKDARGRIVGRCYVKELGEIILFLFWKDSSAVPDGTIAESDRDAFRSSVREVFEWAGRRIQPILSELKQRLKELYGERFKGLYVFGSYARPDAGIRLPDSSDLDIALILSDFGNVYDEQQVFGDTVYDLSLEHSLVISVVPIRETDFREGQSNFTRVISEYAIPVP